MFNYDSRIPNNRIVSFAGKVIPTKVFNVMQRETKNANRVGILIHSSPDPDAVGSAMTIYDHLKSLGKDVVIFANKKELKGLQIDPKKYKIANPSKMKDVDLGWMLDCNKFKRIPANFMELAGKIKKIIGLDHHEITKSTNNNIRIDKSACSTCSLVYRYFEKMGKKLTLPDLEHIYYGMISDCQKSKLTSIENLGSEYKLNKLPKLYKDKNSKEILEKIEAQLPEENRIKILKSLNILSNLTPAETAFQERIFKDIKFTKNGKLAYLVISQNDKQWAKLGMDNTRTSAILGNWRNKILSDTKAKGAIVFYRVSKAKDSVYQMSITTKGNYAKKIRQYIVNNLNPDYIGDGHPHRQGGRVLSCDKKETEKFINDFFIAAEALK